jgi:hypothetical protein
MQAEEAAYADAVDRGAAAVPSVAEAFGLDVVGAVFSRAEGRVEILQPIDGCARPVHAGRNIKKRAGGVVDPNIQESTTSSMAEDLPRPRAGASWALASVSGRNNLRTTMQDFDG